jgi:hypothetical protein
MAMAGGVRRAGAGIAGLAVLAGGLWLGRDLVPGPWNRPPVHTEVSEEAAAAADEKLGRMRDRGDTVRLSGVEFTSYIRYRMAGRFALDLEVPVVSFEGETVRVDGRVPKERIPMSQVPRAGRAFIPDTADVAVSGRLRTLAPGRAALRIESASFARFPVGRELFVPLLDRVAPDEPGVAEDEMAFQLPPGAGAARIENGELVLFPAGEGE